MFWNGGRSDQAVLRQGMMLNHKNLSHHRPDYLQETRRIYTHQASPRLVFTVVGAGPERGAFILPLA